MSRKAFPFWQKFVFDNEGGRGNLAHDPGGDTNHGITWVAYKELGSKVFGSKASYNHWENLSANDVLQFALYFWIMFKGDAIKDDRLAIMIVYAHWGSIVKGVGLVLFIQKWINLNTNLKLTEDGNIYSGNETVAAINSLNANQTNQLAKYALLVSTQQYKQDPNYVHFPGWDKIITFLNDVVNNVKSVAKSPKTYIGIGLGVLGTLLILNNISED